MEHRAATPNLSPADEALLDRLQRAAFGYFTEYANPENGLVPDTDLPDSPCSIAVVGFALSCYPVGVERGWIPRAKAAALARAALRFFADSRQHSAPTEVTGYKGFYYHFLDMRTGQRVWNSELSLIDSTLLVAGMLTAAAYFDADDPVEADIRALADAIYARMDFAWAQDRGHTLAQGWTPEGGFIHYDWEGYSEAIILYALAAASRQLPNMEHAYRAWTRTYQWESIYGYDCLYAGPLFIHLFSHAWLDFRGLSDRFMAARGTDYFRNTVDAIAIHRQYGRLNPGEFAGYGADCWGITACDGPSGRQTMRGGTPHDFFGYSARGVPYGLDDGTLAPWMPLACLPFDEPASLRCLETMLDRYPETLVRGRFRGSFNASLPGPGPAGWLSPGVFGLDQGLVVMMVENYRSGLIWKLTRDAPVFGDGLRAAGFSGGWLT